MGKKVLLIDGQLFQTLAWDRGMGRYSLSLLRTAWASLDHEKIEIICNTALPLHETVRKIIKEDLPEVTLQWLSLMTPKDAKTEQVYDTNKARLARFIEDNFSDAAVDFLELALFQSEYYPVFPDNARKFLIFYDLIPYQYPHVYHPDEDYLSRFRSLFEADHYFAISSTVEKDLIKYLHISPEIVTNIEGGPTLQKLPPSKKKPTATFSIPEKYILAPSGNDYRKNNYRAIQAFEKFRDQSGEDWKLVITSHFHESELERLQQLSSHVIFSGVVDETTLEDLYTHAEMLLFASEYEGLGLPILESVVYRHKIVCSAIEAFQEISPDAFYFFDPLDVQAMADAMVDAYKGVGWSHKKTHYAAIQEKYTWERSAKLFVATLASAKKKVTIAKKERIAVVAPRLADRFAVATIVNTLHPYLNERYSIDYYFDEIKSEAISIRRPSYLECWPHHSIEELDEKQARYYSALLYHIDNSDLNPQVITKALSLPGVVFLYDSSLESAFTNLKERRIISPERLALEAKITSKLHLQALPFLGSVLSNSMAAIDVRSTKLSKNLPDDIKNKLHHSSLALHVDYGAAPKSITKRVILYWNDNVQDQKAIYEFLQLFAQSPLADEIKLSILCAEVVPSEAFLRLSETYPSLAIMNATTEFELDRYLRNTDVVLDVYHEATADYLTLLGKALAQGSFVYSLNLSQLPLASAQLKGVGDTKTMLKLLIEYYTDPHTHAAVLAKDEMGDIVTIIEKHRGEKND